MCEARSRQFEVWQEKTKMFTERSEPVILNICWYLCFPVSRALWFSIRCHCLESCHSASSPLWFLHSRSACAFFSGLVCFYADPLHNQPSLLSAMPHAPALTTIHRCGTNFIAFLYTEVPTYTYIYMYIIIYIQILAQNQTAVIKTSCLAMLGN